MAIVTGGAQGLGRAIAIRLAGEGARVEIADLSADAGRSVVSEIQAAGGRASFRALDVRIEDQWIGLIGEVVEELGALHILVNSAGVSLQASVVDTSFDDWRRVMSTNLDGTFLGIKHAIPAIAASGGGSIVNLSSVDGIVASPDLAAYNASKGGVRLLSKSAALHCGQARNGVRVNSVHPSFVRGPLTDAYLRGHEDPDALLREIENSHPIGFLGEPDDIAHGVLYLASDESRWVTGSELVIDGGWTAA